MEIITALRAIEILGQVLRNEATARKLPEMIGIAEQVFRLGRRLLGFVFAQASDQLETMIKTMDEHCRQSMPKAKLEDIVEEVNRNVFNRYLLAAFAVVKLVSIAVGERNLKEVFRKLVDADPNLANRIYKLAIDLETTAGNLPPREIDDLNAELTGKKKARGTAKGAARVYNNLAHTLVRALVVDYLYLNHVPQKRHQALCNQLDIKRLNKATDPSFKRLPPPGR